MRFLGVTETCDLLALYLRLQADGHAVRVSVSEPLAQGTSAGLIERVPVWQDALEWVGRDGVIVFEAVSEGFGAEQDRLRRDGYRVVGGSAFGDQLENDRAFAQTLLADFGFPKGHVRSFIDVTAAIRYIAARPARYVLKFSGADHSTHDNYVGVLPDGRDVAALLAATDLTAGVEFILMDFIEGIEVGVGAYFDGEHFLEPACLDWEHKRFFAGDLGELTGEMGTVATFDHTHDFFERTLQLFEPMLRDHGHIGYINLNTIVNEDGIWPLEFTCRFGYPGFAVLSPLQEISWADLLMRLTGLGSHQFQVSSGWSVGVVLTTPPFPYSRHKIASPVGLPIFLNGADRRDRSHIHLGEVGGSPDQLLTSGVYGWTAVVTGVAATISDARLDAYRRARKLVIPNVRYRLDIGEALQTSGLERSVELGIFGT